MLEWGGSVACAYAGKLLSEAGIRVVRVVKPKYEAIELTNNPWFDAFLNNSKVSVTLKNDPDGRCSQLKSLLNGSTLVLIGGDETKNILAEFTSLVDDVVVVSITPFGIEGPYANYRAGDLELSAYSGLTYLTPRDISRTSPEGNKPPLKMPGVLPSIYAGTAGAAACLTVLLEPHLFQGQQLDISIVETLIPTLRRELALYQYQSVVASRFMRVWQLAPWGVKRCEDGFVFVQVVEEHHWRGLVQMMGSPDWALDERYCNPTYRFERRSYIEERMAPWLMQVTKEWFATECQKRHLPFAPVNTVADIVRIPQLHFRRFFTATSSEKIGPCTVPRLPYAVWTGAKPSGHTGVQIADIAAGSAQDPKLPLSGIRVVDFGHVWAGPYCTQVLADLGAEVIKIESIKRLDIHRRQGPYPDNEPGTNSSGVWNSQNRGKGSITLNLGKEEGRGLAKQLIARSDVVVENFAPGVMHKLGLDYESLAQVNPRLVMASLSAFGQDGPQKNNVGYGPSLDAWSGLDSQTAYDITHPGPLGGVFPDTGSALHAVVAILQGLLDRQHSGLGRYIDVSELEVSILLLADLLCEYLGTGADATTVGNNHSIHFPYGIFPCAGDDQWIAFSVSTTAEWACLAQLINQPDWASSPDFATSDTRRQRCAEIETAITSWTRRRTPCDCMETLQAAGLKAAAVNRISDILADAHLAERGYFQTVTHPVAGKLQLYGSLWKILGMRRENLKPAPVLGDSTERVLKDILDLTDSAIKDLRDREIVV